MKYNKYKGNLTNNKKLATITYRVLQCDKGMELTKTIDRVVGGENYSQYDMPSFYCNMKLKLSLIRI
jgi:hypothetical protein